MLTIPKPYPDELLYSVLARYFIRSGYCSARKVQVKLFDTLPQQPWDVFLPSNLNRLTQKLWTKPTYTPDYFIQNHTLYPYYSQFLVPVEAELLKRVMTHQGNASISIIAKIPINVDKAYQSCLRFCPNCFEQETNILGEAYWHRIHQIPGVLLCPIHKAVLLKSNVNLNAGSLHYHAADSDTCLTNTSTTQYTDLSLRKMIAYVETIQCLLSSHLSFRGLAWLRKRYQKYSLQKDFLKSESTTKFTFRDSKFFDDFCSFYGEEFLDHILPISFQTSKDYFVQCLLACDLSQTVDRARHILLINFLAPTLTEFFDC